MLSGCKEDMRKSSSASLSNCDSVLANKIFGISLDELQQEGQSENGIPFIILCLVRYIETFGGLGQEGLFHVNGKAETVEWLRQRYENGEEVDLVKEADIPSAVSLLRFFLQELPEPVVPDGLCADLIQQYQDGSSDDELERKLKYFLQQLPLVNYNVLKFLCKFLCNVAAQWEETWNASALGAVFGPDVFHIYTDVEDLKEQETVSRIMTGLLENYEEYFENEEEELSSTNDLSSATEQTNYLIDEDERLAQPDELPEDNSDKCIEMIDAKKLLETEEDFESVNITASTSAHINVLSTSANILGRTLLRVAVERRLLEELHSNIHDLKNSDHVCDSDIKQSTCEVDKFMLDCEEGHQTASIERRDLDDILSNTDVDGGNDTQLDSLEFSQEIQNDYTNEDEHIQKCCRECDVNANSESELSGPENVSFEGGITVTPVPHLTLKSISSSEQEEPSYSYTVWQEECESGEAQLSPQAGRMSHHALEDDSNPILSRRYLDFGQTQRFLLDPESLTSSSKTRSFVRTRRSSFSSREDKDKSPVQLAKKLQKKIRQFEEQFEKEKNCRPSYTDIAANPKVVKWMTELTKLRKQIKEAKVQNPDEEIVPQSRPRSKTLPKSFGSSLDHSDEEEKVEVVAAEEEKITENEKKPTNEGTVELILRKLRERRLEDDMPEDLMKMTKEHLGKEKVALQKSLLYYESIHARPVTREERQVVKPLYDRYRLVKQMLTKAYITPVIGSPSNVRRSQMLQPIIEGETANFFEEIKEEEENNISTSSDFTVELKPSIQVLPVPEQADNETRLDGESLKLTLDQRLSSTHASSMPELLEQLWKARADKKKLRKTLKEFEECFYQQNGRNVQKEDRIPMIEEYKEYKRIKAKLRLLEVLINKQDSSKSI